MKTLNYKVLPLALLSFLIGSNAVYAQNIDESAQVINDKELLITKSGTYKFSGDYTNIIVNVDKNVDKDIVYLILENASINNEKSTPIHIMEAKDVEIVLRGNNQVTQGKISTSDNDFPSAAIYSKADTAISGEGTLTVTTDYQDGINSRDDLIIKSGNITIKALEDGIVGKDLLAIDKANIKIEAGKDGIKTSNAEDIERGNLYIKDGTFNIKANNDAISSENVLQIDNGNFLLLSGNGYTKVIKTASESGFETFINSVNIFESDESAKALKSKKNIIINGGAFNLSAYEDAIHSDGDITIKNGDFTINSGDDAIHAKNTVTIENGKINIINSYEGIEGTFVNINNGTIEIISDDDAINAYETSGGVTVTGGNIKITFKQGGDGIDSNGFFTQTGGNIAIHTDFTGSSRGASLIDADGTITTSGGTLVDGNADKVDTTRKRRGDRKPPKDGERESRPE